MADPVHFLMVDDLDHNLSALEALLRRDGLVLHRARSGAEALEAMLHTDFALALLDVQMPGMDGYELAELMRGIERTRKIPIIFLTAAALDERRRFRGYEAGAVDYITKPIDPMILQSKAQVFYEIGRQAQELARQRDEMRAVSQNLTAALARLNAHADNSPLAIVELDADLVIRQWSKGAERMFGWPAAQVLGRSVAASGWLDEATSAEVADWLHLASCPNDGQRGALAIRAATVAGGEVDCECYGSVVPAGHGAPRTINLQILDVTERRRAEETRSILIGELNHRVKNMLANVQAIARQTARHARDPDHFAKTFGGRLQALARAHSILTAETWSGADLRELLAEQMSVGALSEDRVQLSGPDLRLSPSSALRMALTLHELTTNAVKYGALSGTEGHVALSWEAKGDVLSFTWREEGGPPVVEPDRKGFGSTLIMASDGGEAKVDWRPEGVVWTLQLPLDGANEDEDG
ncbi:sensor histidine kinase [Falsirhodobacter algicola]|uniref:histidine kinase n=1 Tax=Falsirhodobacter algicola TaxID=2692330 RepID=A0A8J8MTK6_9RHOB|nr:HWE histidine kinase domain-containing protein [Falsirhodobacter algicola]QUS36217.1 response regulator [Falsirhodobacter algicola]